MSQRWIGIEIWRVADAAALSRVAAELFAKLGGEAVGERGRFVAALSGGSTPRGMMERLADGQLQRRVPWEQIDLFFSDERAVPPNHRESNFGSASKILLSKVPIDPDRVHRMEAEDDDRLAAAARYQARIAKTFGIPSDGPPPSFDLVLLGMGEDGHTASLFPRTEAIGPTERWVVANDVPAQSTVRLTMTPVLMNRAACVVFLVSGAAKASVLAEVLDGPLDPDRLPAQLIHPENGRLIWIIDHAAAAQLPRVLRPGTEHAAD